MALEASVHGPLFLGCGQTEYHGRKPMVEQNSSYGDQEEKREILGTQHAPQSGGA
jgi:hypothetical protein